MDINRLDENKSLIQNVKQRFFAMRNGALADNIRQSGAPYRIIFGLNVPQLREIAEAFGKNDELAEALWNNITTRESRLLATMIIDPSRFDQSRALNWLNNLSGWQEEIDILCHNVLRKTDYHEALIDNLKNSETDALRYTALRLCFSILAQNPAKIKEIAEKEIKRHVRTTLPVATQLLTEVEYLSDNK